MYYSKKTYTYVPDINFEEESLEHAYRKLDQANLLYPRDQQNFDRKAREHLEKGEDFSDYSFIVTDSFPTPGKFVRQGSAVALSVTWIDLLKAINMTKDEMDDFDPFEFYGPPESAMVYDYNLHTLRLHTMPVGMKAIVNGTEEDDIAVYPPIEEKTIVKARLVDYFTNKAVDEAACYLGDEILFTNIQSGTYYFICSCDGYEFAVSDCLFRTNWDEDLSAYEYDYWEVNLKQEDAYSSCFKIRIQDKQGKTLAGMPVYMRVLREDDLEPDRWLEPEYISDENGYLTNHEGWYLISGGLLEFQVCKGYIAELSLDGEVFVPIPKSHGSEICMTME